ncbi:hypothetical protein [Thermogemmatispora carboxidivorans]|uniref:hypothetical protein n=1 Tax=Thermogemmatispora carboxidivorans TaxID=1382306 RepID=UPI001EE16F58|nr:hypothetical protein [Thermogemmatispora carboxidivorans]
MAYASETMVAFDVTDRVPEQRAPRQRPSGAWLHHSSARGVGLSLIGLLVAWLLAMGSSGPAHAASWDSGTLSSSPSSGPAGTVITVSGSGWTQLSDGTQVSLGYSQQDCLLGYTPASNSQPGTVEGGSFSGWLVLPGSLAPGTYKICAIIQATPILAGSYTLLSSTPPKLSISPTQVTAGQTATVTGSNFLPGGTQVTLVLQASGATFSLGSVTSDGQGNFTRNITIPNGLAGPAQIKASAGNGSPAPISASVSFTINAAPIPDSTSVPSATPTTLPSPTPTHTPTPTSVPPSATADSNTNRMPAIATASTNTGNQAQKTTPASPSSPLGQLLPWLLGATGGGLLLFGLLGGFVQYRQRRQKPANRRLSSVHESETLPLSSVRPTLTNGSPPEQPQQNGEGGPCPAVPGQAQEEQASIAPTEVSLETLMRQVQSGLSVLPGRSQNTHQE